MMPSLGSYLDALDSHSGCRHNSVLGSYKTEVSICLLSARSHSQFLESVSISWFVMPEDYGMEVTTQKWRRARELLKERRIREEACVRSPSSMVESLCVRTLNNSSVLGSYKYKTLSYP